VQMPLVLVLRRVAATLVLVLPLKVIASLVTLVGASSSSPTTGGASAPSLVHVLTRCRAPTRCAPRPERRCLSRA
jgi:ABC-type transporter Mla maintaining outer membrane lipid asymmetry permease subunit MlaE